MPNYIVLDLEMCKVPRHMKTQEFRIKHEIIQIGAVKLKKYQGSQHLFILNLDLSMASYRI